MPWRTYEPLPALDVVDPPADALAFDSVNDGSGFAFARVARVEGVVAAEALAFAWLLSCTQPVTVIVSACGVAARDVDVVLRAVRAGALGVDGVLPCAGGVLCVDGVLP